MKIKFVITTLLFTKLAFADVNYLYKASILGTLNAKININVSEGMYNNQKALKITSNTNVRFLGNEVINIDYLAYNNPQNFAPLLNIECNQDKKDNGNNCKAIKFLSDGIFLYQQLHQDKTNLIELSENTPGIETNHIIDQQPTFNPAIDKVFDIGSIILFVKYLNINQKNPEQDLFVAINHQIALIKVSYVKDITPDEMWIKLTPINPGPDDVGEFPHKIIYNRKIGAVTEVHKKIPIVGNLIVKLVR
jgi:hypothetical protein